MTKIQNSIGQILRPHFCVIRNLDQSVSGVDFPFDVSDLRGEFVGLTCTFDQARQLVPQPEYPEDAVRQDHFHKRFGWNQVAMSDGSMLKQVPSFGFDDDPISDRRQSDTELFGETYTIYWLSPADPGIIASTLIDHAGQLVASDSRSFALQSLLEEHHALGPYSRPCETIDGYVLLYVWQKYFDRMCLWDGNASDRAHADVLETARNGFADQVSRLPHGPSAADWNRLDELLLK